MQGGDLPAPLALLPPPLRTLRPVLSHFCTQQHPVTTEEPSGPGPCLAPIFCPFASAFLIIAPFPLKAFQFNAITLIESLLYTRPCAWCRDTEMSKNKSPPSGSLKSNGETDTSIPQYNCFQKLTREHGPARHSVRVRLPM